MKKTIWYFAKQWPRHNVSAASLRTVGILKSLRNLNYEINFICSQNIVENYTDNLMNLNINCHFSDINNLQSIKDLFGKLPKPQLCFYDTFIAEEYFSHYVYDMFPGVQSILDTQDLHFLRELRRFYYLNHSKDKLFYIFDFMNDKFREELNDYLLKGNNTFLREMSSLIRCDQIILCSDFEKILIKSLLPDLFRKKLNNITFFYDINNQKKLNPFYDRKDYIFLGNFQHKPNRDSVSFIVEKIWPNIFKKFIHEEKPKLKIFGSNMDHKIKNLQNLDLNIQVSGELPETHDIKNYRVMLSANTYGAGIKGKISDSWYYNTPCISSFMGSEALFYKEEDNAKEHDQEDKKNILKSFNMILNDYESRVLDKEKENWGGFYSNNIDDLVDKSYLLYTNEDVWTQKVEIGNNILKERMTYDHNFSQIEYMISKLENSQNNNKDIFQMLLLNENNRATKYLSKYIDIKNNLINYL